MPLTIQDLGGAQLDAARVVAVQTCALSIATSNELVEALAA